MADAAVRDAAGTAPWEFDSPRLGQMCRGSRNRHRRLSQTQVHVGSNPTCGTKIEEGLLS